MSPTFRSSSNTRLTGSSSLAVFELKHWANFSFTSVPSFKTSFPDESVAGGTAGAVAGAGGAGWLVVGELCAAAMDPKHSINIAVLKKTDLHFIASCPLT